MLSKQIFIKKTRRKFLFLINFKLNFFVRINKFKKKLFVDSMEPFNRLQLSKEEFVLLRAIIFSHFVSTGLSQYGRQLLLTEAEKYSDILMKMLQVF